MASLASDAAQRTRQEPAASRIAPQPQAHEGDLMSPRIRQFGPLARLLAVVALVAAASGMAAERASAGFSARVAQGTLRIDGNAASDKLALRLQAGSPQTLQVDVGDDGSANFSFDRSEVRPDRRRGRRRRRRRPPRRGQRRLRNRRGDDAPRRGRRRHAARRGRSGVDRRRRTTTTPSTAIAATTSTCAAAAGTTRSSGTPATAATTSTPRAASTSWSSTARPRRSGSSSRPSARRRGSSVTSGTS